LTEEDKKAIVDQSSLFSLDGANITIRQGIAIDKEISKENVETQSDEKRLRQEIARLNLEVAGYKQKTDSVQSNYFTGKQLLEELTPLFPQIESCSYSEAYIYNRRDTLARKKTGLFMVASKRILPKNEQEKIKNWLVKRLNKKEIEVYFNRSGQ